MNLKAKRVVVASLAAALVGGLAVVALDGNESSGGTSPKAQVAPAARGAARFPWAQGVRHAYALSWRSHTGGLLAPAQGAGSQPQQTQVQAETELDGELVVEGLGPVRDGFLAAVSYGKVHRFAFRMQGQNAVEDEAQVARELSGHPAFVTFSPRGEPVGIAFEPGLPASTRSALRTLVAQLQWTLPPAGASEWSAVERAAVGTVRVQYRRDGEQLHRSLRAFESLDAVPDPALDGQQALSGGARLVLDEEGALESLTDQGDVRYTRRGATEPALAAGWSFTLERLRQERFDAAALRARAQTPEQAFSQPVADAELGTRRDARLAQGLSVDSLLQDIHGFEAGQRPSHELLVKAGAFLRLHPEACVELVRRFQSPELSVKGRGLILDMLAQAGDGPAQAAIRSALETPAAQERPRDFSILAQRFTFVVAPEPESAEFLVRQLDRARGAGDVTSAQGAAVALGSTVRRLTELGQEDAARRYGARLRHELEYARDPGMQRGLLAALGNAARVEDVDAIRAHAGSNEPLVRDQVASSLRHLNTPAARETLLALATDAHATVAISVFSSLRTQTLEARDWATLARVVQSGKTPIAADAALLTLVREKREAAGPHGDAILAVLLARNGGGDNDLADVIRSMLAVQ